MFNIVYSFISTSYYHMSNCQNYEERNNDLVVTRMFKRQGYFLVPTDWDIFDGILYHDFIHSQIFICINNQCQYIGEMLHEPLYMDEYIGKIITNSSGKINFCGRSYQMGGSYYIVRGSKVSSNYFSSIKYLHHVMIIIYILCCCHNYLFSCYCCHNW